MKVTLGIDIAKLSFEVALHIRKKYYCKKFNNTDADFNKLIIWLHSKNIASVHACMEATGNYGLKLAEWLSDRQVDVSIMNSAIIKGFAQSQLTRNKTDSVEAKLIALLLRCSIPSSGFLQKLKYGSSENGWIDVSTLNYARAGKESSSNGKETMIFVATLNSI